MDNLSTLIDAIANAVFLKLKTSDDLQYYVQELVDAQKGNTSTTISIDTLKDDNLFTTWIDNRIEESINDIEWETKVYDVLSSGNVTFSVTVD